jgi:hypothetical protein
VRELLIANVMVNTALVSPFSGKDSQKAIGGLGILAHLPLITRKNDALEPLCRLRQILRFNI